MIIQTYYQKHRQIQAFQFNGTWDQLEKELPITIWERLLHDLWRANYAKIELSMSTNLIQTLQIYNSYWICHSKPIKKRYQRFSKRLQLPSRFKKYRPNQHQTKKLQLHDYVTIMHIYKKLHFDHKPKYLKLIHRTRIVEQVMIQIQPPYDFEAHWSKTPIKPSN